MAYALLQKYSRLSIGPSSEVFFFFCFFFQEQPIKKHGFYLTAILSFCILAVEAWLPSWLMNGAHTWEQRQCFSLWCVFAVYSPLLSPFEIMALFPLSSSPPARVPELPKCREVFGLSLWWGETRGKMSVWAGSCKQLSFTDQPRLDCSQVLQQRGKS